MSNENENYDLFLDVSADSDNDSFDFDELETQLENRLEEELSDMQLLESEKEKIGNPDELGNIIKDVVWEQFLNQIAVTAGEDFIEANRGMNLDLRKDSHIQTTENFANGKIATHNTNINYQERYDDWQKNFQKDSNGNVITHKTRTGKDEATLKKNARVPFDKERPSGSKERHTDMDHTVSAAEIIRDPKANAHLSKDEQIAFANSDANLYEMDSSLNRSKSDNSTSDWLDNPNANGQKPKDIFDISDEDDKNMRKKDKEAREEYEKVKDEGEKKSIEAGKQSRKAEAFRISGAALKAVIMQLLADLVKEIIGKLVLWFKKGEKTIETLIDSIKTAIKSFVSKLKEHLVNTANVLVTTIATAIIGPVVGTIKKVWMMLKQGWKSLKKGIDFLKNPENKNMPFGLKMMEVGKIVIVGLTGVGALVLGDVIEKGLLTVPPLAVEIPLLGSLANIIGIFMGAVVSGIIGAIAINLIDKTTAKMQKNEITNNQIDKGNEALALQKELHEVTSKKFDANKAQNINTMQERHHQAKDMMKEMVDDINSKQTINHEDDLKEVEDMLKGLLD